MPKLQDLLIPTFSWQSKGILPAHKQQSKVLELPTVEPDLMWQNGVDFFFPVQEKVLIWQAPSQVSTDAVGKAAEANMLSAGICDDMQPLPPPIMGGENTLLSFHDNSVSSV